MKKNNLPQFPESTKIIELDKSWFSFDLFWSSANKHETTVDNIVVIYMLEPQQEATDTLCKLFGYDRVHKITIDNLNEPEEKYILKEGLRQLEYYKAISENKEFTLNARELYTNYLKIPKQRVIDFHCKKYGTKLVLKTIKKAYSSKEIPNTVFHILRQMVEYYEEKTSQ